MDTEAARPPQPVPEIRRTALVAAGMPIASSAAQAARRAVASLSHQVAIPC